MVHYFFFITFKDFKLVNSWFRFFDIMNRLIVINYVSNLIRCFSFRRLGLTVNFVFILFLFFSVRNDKFLSKFRQITMG